MDIILFSYHSKTPTKIPMVYHSMDAILDFTIRKPSILVRLSNSLDFWDAILDYHPKTGFQNIDCVRNQFKWELLYFFRWQLYAQKLITVGIRIPDKFGIQIMGICLIVERSVVQTTIWKMDKIVRYSDTIWIMYWHLNTGQLVHYSDARYILLGRLPAIFQMVPLFRCPLFGSLL